MLFSVTSIILNTIFYRLIIADKGKLKNNSAFRIAVNRSFFAAKKAIQICKQ